MNLKTRALIKRSLQHFFQKNKPHRPHAPSLFRIATKIDPLALLPWLKNQPQMIKLYWSDRFGEFETAGIGTAFSLHENSIEKSTKIFETLLPLLNNQNHSLRFYGGFRFERKSRPSAQWASFGQSWFFLPRFELLREQQKTYFICHILLKPGERLTDHLNKTLHEIDKINFSQSPSDHNLNPYRRRIDLPSKAEWTKRFSGIMQKIKSQRLQKIVLARQSVFTFPQTVLPLDLLSHLKRNSPKGFHFYFQPRSGIAFLGNSPERLFKQSGKKIISEALAGTRLRGVSVGEDLQFENELLSSFKELREHRFVDRKIRADLLPFCQKLKTTPLSLMKLNHVQHLYKQFRGILKNHISPATLLSRLHPTPAVAGLPSLPALLTLSRFEKFDRGWYSAPLGWISPKAADFIVAIRSALINKKKIFLYAGAGIVKGSTAAAEWTEIENKMEDFFQAITQ